MNMRARVAQCRLLAQHTTDERAARILLQMAGEGEKDIERLERERGATGAPPGISQARLKRFAFSSRLCRRGGSSIGRLTPAFVLSRLLSGRVERLAGPWLNQLV